MNDDNEWAKLIRDVELAHAAKQRHSVPLKPKSADDPYGFRRIPVVPNVLPPYLAKTSDQAKRRSASGTFLAIASLLAVVFAGAYFILQNRAAHSNDSTNSAVLTSTGRISSGSGAWGGGNAIGQNGNPEFRTSIQSALESRLRPAGLLETLYGNRKLDWLKIPKIDLPKGDKPLTVVAVLYAQLDNTTEKRWRDAGLFKNEGIIATPFVRKISIANRESLDLLLDWHVEGVLAALPNLPGK